MGWTYIASLSMGDPSHEEAQDPSAARRVLKGQVVAG